MKLSEIVKEISESKSERASPLPVLELNQPGRKFEARAGIASYLVPNADSDVHLGTQIYVTGYDGPNLDGKLYQHKTSLQGTPCNIWLQALGEWLDRGADITYFLIKPSSQAVNHLKELAAVKHKGKLRVYSIRKTAKKSASLRRILADWKTTHFAVFEKPSQFWLEGRHEPNVTEAQNCYFLPRSVAEKSPLPEEYKNRLQFVIRNCGKPLIPKTVKRLKKVTVK